MCESGSMKPADRTGYLQTPVEEAPAAEEVLPASGSAGIRIQRCSCCGKVLFVKEEEGCLSAFCNACGVSYMQKI